jgi:signal-transduction protein with cAMP-binding, CBS, and nucleotidyltransferase domain
MPYSTGENRQTGGKLMIQLEFLEKLDAFKELNDDQLAAIKECIDLAEFKRGERIFSQGADAGHVWVVLEGGVELRTEDPGRNMSAAEPSVSFLSEAQAFGWTCFVPPYKYQLSGYCASRSCRLIRLKREDLLGLFEKDAAIGFFVMKYLIGVVGGHFGQLQDEIARKRGIEIMSRW